MRRMLLASAYASANWVLHTSAFLTGFRYTRKDLLADMVAGVTIGVMVIPQGKRATCLFLVLMIEARHDVQALHMPR
jgi:hypothetical protein